MKHENSTLVWPVWVSWLSIIPFTKRSLAQFPVRAHAGVVSIFLSSSTFLYLTKINKNIF